MTRKQTATFLVVIFTIALTFSACSSKKKCSTRNKKQVEMGWM